MPDEQRIIRAREADPQAMADAIFDFLKAAGFDTGSQDHLQRSGQRVAEAWAEDLLGGYANSPEEALGEPFSESAQDLVLVQDIEFFSSCPHHLMPYAGKAHIAYIPDGLAIGFSGVVRLLDSLAHRLTLQEWLCRDVADTLMKVLRPQGAACILQATPMCVFARGVKRPCRITSSAYRGVFDSDPERRRELLLACGEKA